MGSQLAEKRQFGHLALDGARALARSTLPEPSARWSLEKPRATGPGSLGGPKSGP